VKRKSVTYLNELKNDVQETLDEIRELATDINSAGYDLALISPHDLKTNDEDCKDLYTDLKNKNYQMSKLLKEFMKRRALYLEFF
jgi:uncharacterized protein (UPF0335 family)